MDRKTQKFFNEFLCSRSRTMKPIAVPSLQHLSMVKIAIELWNQIDLRKSIVNFEFVDDYRKHHRKWRTIEEKTLSKVAQLPIPEGLKKDFLSAISPIGLQIKNWYNYHHNETALCELPKKFVWTPLGTIDRLKTAECLVKDENTEVETRFRLSCLYCLEDEIPEAWERLDEELKHDYYDTKEDVSKCDCPFLVRFWTYHLKGELSQLYEWFDDEGDADQEEKTPMSLWAYKHVVDEGNKEATEFFLDKLTDEQKNEYLAIGLQFVANHHANSDINDMDTPKEYYAEFFLFLLSRMRKSQQILVFQNCTYHVLECLFEWPNTLLFVELAERTVRSNPDDVIGLIINNIANGWTDCTSRQLFHHFWQLCPLSYKRRAIEEIDYCTILKLYEGNDVAIIRKLFQHACAAEKKNLVMCRRDLDSTASLIKKVRGWKPNKKTVVKFREEFLEGKKK